jgi:hypothetical protein
MALRQEKNRDNEKQGKENHIYHPFNNYGTEADIAGKPVFFPENKGADEFTDSAGQNVVQEKPDGNILEKVFLVTARRVG